MTDTFLRPTGPAIFLWPLCALMLVASVARGDSVTYTLDNVTLDDNSAPMYGTLVYTYPAGDFPNGTGQFTYLDIPFTVHDHTDLDTVVDVGSSIEITLAGSVHDDGVDITLFLEEPLTAATPAAIDLARSKYEIGGNGFHTGAFLSGSVVPSGATNAGDPPGAGIPNVLTASPNPFRPGTTVSYVVASPGHVRVSVHDVSGRAVRTLVDRWQSPGRHSVAWSGTGLASGTYFLRSTAGADTRTLKVVRLR